MRLAFGYKRKCDLATTQGVAQLEKLMHNIGRGALDIWLRMVMRDISKQESGSRELKENLGRILIARTSLFAGLPISMQVK